MKKQLPGALKKLDRATAYADEAGNDVDAAMMEVGEAIRHDRMQKKISLRKFAAEVRISPAYLSDIELGNRYPAYEVLERIKETLTA